MLANYPIQESSNVRKKNREEILIRWSSYLLRVITGPRLRADATVLDSQWMVVPSQQLNVY
jgi:hypothetical protein